MKTRCLNFEKLNLVPVSYIQYQYYIYISMFYT
jgi:hypothetical protein